MGRTARILLCVMLAAPAAQAMAAASATQLDNMRAHGLAWLYTHQQGDGSWQTAAGFKLQPTGLAIDALNNAGLKNAYPVTAAQAWIANVPASSNDSLARQTIAIAHSGANAQASAQRLIGQRDGQSLGWGAYKQYQAGFPDTALALDAILASGLSYADTGYGLGFIISHQNVNGGWPNSATEPGVAASHLIPSAHSVYTLSRYKQVQGYNVDSNITNGVNWLKSVQKADGGFAEDSSASSGNPYDTALVYLALNQAKLAGNAAAVAAQSNIDNAQLFLVNTQTADGSWSGGDALATALALQAVPATTLTDTDHDGIPDVVEALIGTNPNVADARGLAGGNGLAVSGLTVAKLLANATIGQPFNYSIVASGGVAPYQFSLSSGVLPDGLTLNTATGVISGTPSRVGPFNFAYSVSDANNLSIGALQGQIQVAALNDNNDVPTLPEWGAMLMAALLLATQIRRNQNSR